VRAVLVFDLPGDAEAHRTALDAGQYAAVLKCHAGYLRHLLEHGEVSRAERATLEQCREHLVAALAECEVGLPA
jgi:hypothetical protein